MKKTILIIIAALLGLLAPLIWFCVHTAFTGSITHLQGTIGLDITCWCSATAQMFLSMFGIVYLLDKEI